MTELTNMKALEEKVREKVVTTFASLIPESVFDDLVSKAIKEYFEDTTKSFVIEKISEGVYYNSGSVTQAALKLTPFKYLVWSELHKLTKTAIEEFFTSRREEIKKSMLEKYTSSSTIKGLENASLEVIMTRQQETMFQVMLTSALESYKYNLVQTFHQAGNVDIANKLNELQVLIPDATSARI